MGANNPFLSSFVRKILCRLTGFLVVERRRRDKGRNMSQENPINYSYADSTSQSCICILMQSRQALLLRALLKFYALPDFLLQYCSNKSNASYYYLSPLHLFPVFQSSSPFHVMLGSGVRKLNSFGRYKKDKVNISSCHLLLPQHYIELVAREETMEVKRQQLRTFKSTRNELRFQHVMCMLNRARMNVTNCMSLARDSVKV